jgi:hypothetical protein
MQKSILASHDSTKTSSSLQCSVSRNFLDIRTPCTDNSPAKRPKIWDVLKLGLFGFGMLCGLGRFEALDVCIWRVLPLGRFEAWVVF